MDLGDTIQLIIGARLAQCGDEALRPCRPRSFDPRPCGHGNTDVQIQSRRRWR